MNIIKIILSIITLTFYANANKIANLKFNVKVNGKIKEIVIPNIKFSLDEDAPIEKIEEICNDIGENEKFTNKVGDCIDNGEYAYYEKSDKIAEEEIKEINKDTTQNNAKADRLDKDTKATRADTKATIKDRKEVEKIIEKISVAKKSI